MVTGTINVRDGSESDLPALTDLYNHYVRTSPATFDTEPFTAQARREWLSHYHPSGRHRLLVATRGDALLGYATSSPHRPKAAYATSVETSIYCHPDALGQGIGTLLYGHLFEVLRGEDVHRAFAGITMPNEPSVRLHRRFGFTDVGTFREVGRKYGRYWDTLWLGRPLP